MHCTRSPFQLFWPPEGGQTPFKYGFLLTNLTQLKKNHQLSHGKISRNINSFITINIFIHIYISSTIIIGWILECQTISIKTYHHLKKPWFLLTTTIQNEYLLQTSNMSKWKTSTHSIHLCLPYGVSLSIRSPRIPSYWLVILQNTYLPYILPYKTKSCKNPFLPKQPTNMSSLVCIKLTYADVFTQSPFILMQNPQDRW